MLLLFRNRLQFFLLIPLFGQDNRMTINLSLFALLLLYLYFLSSVFRPVILSRNSVTVTLFLILALLAFVIFLFFIRLLEHFVYQSVLQCLGGGHILVPLGFFSDSFHRQARMFG